MKNVMHDKRFSMVAIVAGLVAVLPLFVVMAAQGQITEVNPSGVTNLHRTVDVGGNKLNISAKTMWKVIGNGDNASVLANFDFSAAEISGDGSPIFKCNGVGNSLGSLVTACIAQLPDPVPDNLAGLGDLIGDFGGAALGSLNPFGTLEEAPLSEEGTSGLAP